MPKFKVLVSKGHKKYSMILNADSEVLVRKKVHNGWYSILNVEEISGEKIKWHKFIFKAINQKWEIKKWKVVTDDPLKVYIKLEKWLWYIIKELYSEKDNNKTQEEKINFLNNIKEQYLLFKKHNNKTEVKTEIVKEKKEHKNSLDNFYMKKELDKTYKLIDFVLKKIKNFLEKEWLKIDSEKKIKLQTLYNSIIKIKKTTNINKLKEVWILSLKKIWEIELEYLEKNKDNISKDLLKNTNILLKKLGSNKTFVKKNKDINYLIKNSLESIKEIFIIFKKDLFWKKDKENNFVEKNSYSYWKTELLIKKYSEKLVENKILIIKLFFKFYKKEERLKLKDLKLKEKVIKQNIYLLKLKQNWKKFSYTKILQKYNIFLGLLLNILKLLNTYILFFIYIFSITILMFFILNKYNLFNINLNIEGILILIYILFWSFLIFISRWILSVSINIAIFIFMIILWIVNF